jgi:hypothetical protein
MNAIIGYTGFIGSYLLSKLDNIDLYNRSNILNIINKNYNIIYFCGLYASKWYINNNKDYDDYTINQYLNIIKNINFNRFILISTIDVYNNNNSYNENDISNNIYSYEVYGKNRLYFEEQLKLIIDINKLNIIRLPSIFGYGMKKNIIYDLIYNNNLEDISLESEFQWYPINRLYDDINYVYNHNIRLINLFTEPIKTIEIINKFFPILRDICDGKNIIKYNHKTIFKDSGYWLNKDEIFIEFNKLFNNIIYWKNIQSKLAISNMAWNSEQWNIIKPFLKYNKLNNLEISFRKFDTWDNININTIHKYLCTNINYISAQGILYDTNIDLANSNINDILKHFEFIFNLCYNLSIKIVILGSPNKRHLNNKDEQYIVDLFTRIGELAYKYNIYLCIENNSYKYGGTWLTKIETTLNFVKKLGHPNIRVNFDIGNYNIDEENYKITKDDINYIYHVQVSYDYLKQFNGQNRIYYNIIYNKLCELYTLGYNNYISLEMINIDNSVDIIKSIYTFINLPNYI